MSGAGGRAPAQAPPVSVVVPCSDDRFLPDTLASLARQRDAPAFEVVVVAAGRVSPGRWGRGAPPIRVATGPPGATSAANRNQGAAAARGDLLLFVDADDTVSERYVAAMAAALGEHDVVCSSVDVASLNPWNPGGTHPQRSGPIIVEMRFLPFAGAGTLGVRRSAFEDVGGFDESLRRLEEADLCWRLQLAGHGAPVLVPGATLRYRLEPRVAVRVRKVVALGVAQAGLYRRYRAVGMPRETLREAATSWRCAISGGAGRLVGRRNGNVGWPVAIRTGRLLGSLRHRALYP